MRTKTLLLTAALGAASLSTLMAQAVYSINAVGFVNIDIAVGFTIIANPLMAASNKVADLIPAPPDGTAIYKFGAGGFTLNLYDGGWAIEDQTLVPGEGAFIKAPEAFKITFVGEVKQGSLSHSIPSGFSLQSSEVPLKGHLETVLKFPAVDGDVVYRFNRITPTGGYSTHLYDAGFAGNVDIDVAEGFFTKKVAQIDWKHVFSVNP